MTQTLRDFINAREGEIRAQIRALNDELRELRAAKSAISEASLSHPGGSPSGRTTHRDMIVAVLDANPNGGTSERVIEMVKEQYGVDIPQASMSSQLSRAKSDNVLTLDISTKVWRLAKHSGKENEPPLGGSETGEVGASPKPIEGQLPGLPSTELPDQTGQTRHWKLPGT